MGRARSVLEAISLKGSAQLVCHWQSQFAAGISERVQLIRPCQQFPQFRRGEIEDMFPDEYPEGVCNPCQHGQI